MLWVVLIVITPKDTNGTLLFYLVLGCVGIVTLHWTLGRLGWTVSFGAAAVIRVFPWFVAAVAAAMLHVGVSAAGVAAVAILELVTGIWILRFAAARPEGWIEPLDEAEAGRPRLWDTEAQYDEDMASLVRAARLASRW